MPIDSASSDSSMLRRHRRLVPDVAQLRVGGAHVGFDGGVQAHRHEARELEVSRGLDRIDEPRDVGGRAPVLRSLARHIHLDKDGEGAGGARVDLAAKAGESSDSIASTQASA